ncbi:MAG: DUF5060 domain-containing protein [Planctomycetota bacterium]
MPRLLLALSAALYFSASLPPQVAVGSASLTVEPKGVWDSFEFKIPTAASAPGGLSEASLSPDNPFLDYRFHAVMVSPSGRVFQVPGFYAADGFGGDRGAVWKLRFTPDEPGGWGFIIQFERGNRLNIQPTTVAGTPVFPHGFPFFFHVGPRRSTATGFYAKGPIDVRDGHHLRHRDGSYFLKTGTNSPENFLGYAGFDGARDLGGLPRNQSFLHRYANHRVDWRPGDPNWSSGGDPDAGKGIIGALNYLAGVGVNGIYFLPMNLGGDAQDTFPFLDPTGTSFAHLTHYDVGRMEQWNMVFEHAQSLGIMLDFVLAEEETENVRWFGIGDTDARRLFLKQMVAMFGHHPGMRWILCEENAPEPNFEFTVGQLSAMGNWIRQWSPLPHPIGVHTIPDDLTLYQQILTAPFDSSWLSSASLQVHSNYNPTTENAVALFASAGRSVAVHVDEIGPEETGVSATNHEHIRKLVLWDVLLSGGQIAWYFGAHALPVGGDQDAEDFRTRDGMWRFTRHARRLLERVPFHDMMPADDLVTNDTRHATYGDAEVLAQTGVAYVVYYAAATATGSLDLSAEPAGRSFEGRWYDPRLGVDVGAPFGLAGGGVRTLPSAPSPAGADWVLLVRRR